MQIFEITNRQTVSEISFNDIASKVGTAAKYAAQAPARAFNRQAGVEYAPVDQYTSDIGKKAQDAQKMFHQAVYLLTHNFDDTAVMANLMNQFGASATEASEAIDYALEHINRERAINPNFAPQMTRATTTPEQELASTGAFSNMTQQLAQNQPTTAPSLAQRRAARTAISNPATTTAPAVPQTPEQRRIARQRLAAVQADAEATAPTAATDINNMSPEQRRIMKQKFAGSMARAQMGGNRTSTAAPESPAAAVAPTTLAASEPQATTEPLQGPIKIGGQTIKPGDPVYDRIQKMMSQPPAMKESLAWSRGFDPSLTLLKKIKS